MTLQTQIINKLKAKFSFPEKGMRGKWMRGGKCPQCGEAELHCAAVDPKIVRCGRQNNCGYEESVKSILPELFENWSDRFPKTEREPNAAADAYLQHERGLDLMLLRGTYTEELYRDRKTGATTATVRFPFGDTYWERLIDRPGRFGKKAHFKTGGEIGGNVWMPKGTTMEVLAKADEILLAEGIFNATALTQVHRFAVSTMSCAFWPERFLADLRNACIAAGRKDFPRLVWAFDVGAAGVTWTRKFSKRASDEGWETAALMIHPDGDGKEVDWNDLLLSHQNWKGDPEDAPLGDKAFDTFRHNGAITLAETAHAKAKLIAERKIAISGFDFRHGKRMWWAKIEYADEEDRRDGMAGKVRVEEICNCAFKLLYRERDEVQDETTYFLQVDFPDQPTVKARFSSNALAASGEFKKRMIDFAGSWSGTGEQLDRIIRNQTRKLKVVQPIASTGYSPDHGAWVLGDLAVHQGRVVKINAEKYFDIGKSAVKLRSSEQLLDITYDPDQLNFDWLPHVYTAWGPKGLLTLAFFTMSLFAVQIRKEQASLGFLEVTGEAGAGKSTMIEFFWRLFGRAGYEGDDPNKGTMAFLARTLMKVSNMPVGLIEGNRDEDKAGARRFDYNELLVLYNGRSPRGTGAKTGGFETYSPPFLGSIYLMQNERIDAIPAVLERLMSIRIDKSMWSPSTKDAAVKIERWPLDAVSGTIVHIVKQEEAWLKHFRERFDHHDNDMPRRVKGLHNARPIKCHSQLAAAVEALPYLFPNCRAEWVEETLRVVDGMALDRQESCGGDHPLVSSFWEKVQWLLDHEKHDDHAEGKSINQHRDPHTMAVNLVDFEAKCRNAGLNLPDMDKLKKVLRGSKSHKFQAMKPVNNPAGKSVKCWVFEWAAPKEERII